ncbi:MAG: GntR family transcriptional regulator [Clostridiales Family XIII bacterium]|nr:GntR family transcriptional regulator [Clostridiales Family XIII bacterium]
MTVFKSEQSAAAGLPLSGSLFLKLREDILKEDLKRGEKLTEQRICDEYRVSRTPVREALKQLETEGLIEVIPNRGAHVVGFSKQDMEDLFVLRKLYELQAVRWAVARITKEEMEKLEETFDFMEFYTRKNDRKKMRDINNRFHQIIYGASRNRTLQQALSSYQAYMKYSSQNAPYEEEHLQTVFDEHKKIYEAFLADDAGAGAEAMGRHIDNSFRRASAEHA